jgi:hypothetical protein
MAAMVSAPAQRARPETNGRSDGDRPLPVLPALEPLFSTGGLRRGSAVTVRGSAALLLALLAGPSRRGAWCGVVGLPGLGLVAAAEAGIELERLALVPDPGPDWASVAAALLDAMEVVVVAPPGRVLDGDVRRLAARARQRGAVLVPFGAMAWPGAELRLSLASGAWEGLGDGSGRLRSRRVLVRGEGRGSAARTRELALWLPGPDGEISAVPEPALRAVPALVEEPVLDEAVGDVPRLRAVPDLPAPGPPLPRVDPSPAGPPDAGAAPVISPPAITTLWQDVTHRPAVTPATGSGATRRADPATGSSPGRRADPATGSGAGRRADPAAGSDPGRRADPATGRSDGRRADPATGRSDGRRAGTALGGNSGRRAGPGAHPVEPGWRGGVPGWRVSAAPPPRARPAGIPVPAGRHAPVGGGPPVSPPPPTAGTGARPAIPAEVLARLRPASSLPRPPRPARAAEG